jgi:hypothetical protein
MPAPPFDLRPHTALLRLPAKHNLVGSAISPPVRALRTLPYEPIPPIHAL